MFARSLRMAPVLLLFAATPIWAQFDELVHKVPFTANAIFLVNVDKVLASPVAVNANWKAKHEVAYAAGVTILPANATHAVMAAHFDFESMVSLWETAILHLGKEPSLAAFAKANDGALGTIDGLPVVSTPADAYVVQFEPQIVAAMSPASRQTIGRWIRQTKSSPNPALAPYLWEAYRFANEVGTPIIMAIDLEHVASTEQITEGIRGIELLKNEKLDLAETAKFLAGVRGMMLGVTLKDKPFGKIRVDFNSEIAISPVLAKHLLIQALAAHGAILNELYDWTPAVKEKTFTLEGDMTAGGLRRVFSLFDRPPVIPPKEPETAVVVTTPAPKPDQAEIQATRAYIANVTAMLDDLRNEPRDNPGYSVGQIGVWYDTYARKIDRLSTMYVDKEAADTGYKVAENLRNASRAVREGAATGRIGMNRVPRVYNYYTYNNVYGYAYRWNPWNGGGVFPVGGQETYAVEDIETQKRMRNQARSEARIKSLNEAKSYVDQIYSDLNDVRQRLSQKYQAKF